MHASQSRDVQVWLPRLVHRFPVFNMLHWSILGLARGRRPALRHDDTEWSDEDEQEWAVLAGEDLGWR